MDDSTILEAFRQKKTNAEEEKHFAEVCDFIYNKLFPNAKVLTKGDKSAADELVWTAIKAFWQKGQKNPDFVLKGSWVGYLTRIMQNKWKDYLAMRAKADKPTSETTFSDISFTPFNVFDEIPDLHTLFWQEVEKLTPHCKRIFTLNLKEQLKFSEIADQMLTNENNARQIFHACKQVFIRNILNHPQVEALKDRIFLT
ncbi:MAG TPA: sigma-70 family RNA polymerase sigma factor [Chitinophagales bacterium]|nr:sigma-70 family RNA polymerase sigma factor [Chitinophagales bacterium]